MPLNFPKWKRRVPVNQLGCEVVTTNISENPSCIHGPTVVFEQYFDGGKCQKSFRCSAYRETKDCSFFLYVDQCPSKEARAGWVKNIKDSKPNRSHQDEYKRFARIASVADADRGFCTVCEMLVSLPSDPDHEASLRCNDITIVSPVTPQQLRCPSQLLPLREKNKCEAQFLFSPKSLAMAVSLVGQTEAEKVLCLGTPSVHEVLYKRKATSSMLLDIDRRYRCFYPITNFVHFNMFNHHFFDGNAARKRVANFLKGASKVTLICDPPFGGKLELLNVTLEYLNELWRSANEIKDDSSISLILIFPYFQERQVQKTLPNMAMLDYQFDYVNHSIYTSEGTKASKKGSVVRAYVSRPGPTFRLPGAEGYRNCGDCKKWVYAKQVHCDQCKGCMGKDGSAYVHCSSCAACVKQTWVHCAACGRCAHPNAHECKALPAPSKAKARKREVANACHICGEEGHKRSHCPRKGETAKEGDGAKKSKRRKKDHVKEKTVTEADQCMDLINELLKK